MGKNNWKNNFVKDNIYFETENGILYKTDSISFLTNNFPQNSIDLLLLDPPFDIWEKVMLFEYVDILKQNSFLLFFSRQPYTFKIMSFFNTFSELTFRDELIWYDPQPIWVSNQLPLRTHENIEIYRKGKKECNLYIIPNDNFVKNKQIKKGITKISKWKSEKERIYTVKDKKMITSILQIPRKLNNKQLGRIQKPEKLIEILIKGFSNEQDIILDPFMGSGTTAIVCEKLNRKWIGVEIDETRCNIIIQ